MEVGYSPVAKKQVNSVRLEHIDRPIKGEHFPS